MKIKTSDLKQIRDRKDRLEYIESRIQKCDPGDPVFLSDHIVNAGTTGGDVTLILAELESDAHRVGDKPLTWKIQVLRDEWGNTPQPGDTVKKVNKRPLKGRDGQFRYTPDDMSIAKIDGSYSEQFEEIREYPVDEKGCIECTFTDAVYFLNTYGLHAYTNKTMQRHQKPYSHGPVECPDGQKRHVHYWRYKEAPKDIYDKLQKIKKRESTRGVDDAKSGTNSVTS